MHHGMCIDAHATFAQTAGNICRQRNLLGRGQYQRAFRSELFEASKVKDFMSVPPLAAPCTSR
jgi:hypothetical protein